MVPNWPPVLQMDVSTSGMFTQGKLSNVLNTVKKTRHLLVGDGKSFSLYLSLLKGFPDYQNIPWMSI